MDFKTNSQLYLAIDHGFSMGPILGLENPIDFLNGINIENIDGVIAHRGIIKILGQESRYNDKFIMHLTGGGLSPDLHKEKFLVATLEDALDYNVKAVSFQINIGSNTELQQIESAAAIVSAANRLGLQVMGMIYDINPNAKLSAGSLVRLGVEIGFDCIKVVPPDSLGELQLLIKITPIPIIIAGGHKMNEDEFLSDMHDYIKLGVGISVGRNIFQNPTPNKLIMKLKEFINEKKRR